MTRVLITGATGFVGQTLIPHLLSHGYHVRAALRRPAPVPAAVEPALVGELGPTTEWLQALAGVDLVVHLAARVHVMGETGPEAAAHYHRTNVEGTRRLAEAAAAAGVRRFLLMSSVKALGEGGHAPLTEATPPAPTDPYGCSKLGAEVALAQAAGTAMSWVVFRPPLVYGPGVGANFLKLLRLSRSGLPLPLAAIDNRRSLVFAGNLADAVCRALDHPGAANRRFLVHDGAALAVPELIRRLAHHFGRPARLFPVPPAVLRLTATALGARGAFERLCGSLEVDDSALRNRLGWVAPVTVDEGLKATVAWYRDRPINSGRSRRPGND